MTCRYQLLALVGSLLLSAHLARAADCDVDGVDDAEQIAADPSLDCNDNGLLDSCDTTEQRAAFDVAESSAVAPLPRGLYPLDIDGDGGRDLVVDTRSTAAGSLLLLRGNGDGTFSTARTLGVRGRDDIDERQRVAPGDFDGDGDADLAVIDRANREISVLLQDADGEFAVAWGWKPSSETPLRVVVAKVDADEVLDLAVVVDAGVQVLRGQGDGTFLAGLREPTGRRGLITGLVAADFDGDGDDDIIVHHDYDDRLLLFISEGDGVLAGPGAIPVPAVRNALAADLDGDGDIDLATTGGGTGALVNIVEGRGNGMFDDYRSVGVLPTMVPYELAVADVDNDGVVDLAGTTHPGYCAYPGGALWVLRGLGDGEFVQRPVLQHLGGYTVAPIVMDLDGDARTDLVSLRPFDELLDVRMVRLSVESEDCNSDGVPDECQLAVDDCNLDGVLDECQLAELDLNGNGRLDSCDRDCDDDGVPDDLAIAEGAPDCNDNGVPDGCELAALDRDGNGVPDECEIAESPELDCNGNGVPDAVDLASQLRLRISPEPVSGVAASGADVVDFDGDGTFELIVSEGGGCCPPSSGRVRLLRWRGGALHSLGVLARTEAPGPLRAADFDGDGLLDLALLDSPGEYCLQEAPLRVYYALAPGQLGRPVEIDLGARGKALEVADLDLDGAPDMLVLSSTRDHPGQIHILLAAQGFVGEEVLDTALSPGSLAVADLDDDGDPDLVVSSWQSETLLVYANDGRGRFEPAPGVPAPVPLSFVLAHDLDDDGDVDLAASGHQEDFERDHTIYFWRNQGGGVFERAGGLRQHSELGRLFAADFDGDGRTDLGVAAGWNPDPDTEPNSVAASVRLRVGELEYSEPKSWLLGGETPTVAFAVDVTEDGLPELVLGSHYEGRLGVFVNRGGGRFAAPRVSWPLDDEYRYPTLTVGDFDGDGRDDLIGTGGEPSGVVLLQVDDEGALERTDAVAVDEFPWSAALGRVDGDQHVDVVTVGWTSVSLVRGRGVAGFGASEIILEGDAIQFLTLGDFDADDDLDIVTTAGNEVLLLRGDGAGFFAPAETVDVGNGWVGAVVTADVDGDSRSDLALLRYVDNEPHLHVHFGPDLSAEPLRTSLPENSYALAGGDTDGDGDDELVIGGWQAGAFIVDLAADGALQGRDLQGAMSPWSIAVVDLDGDGRGEVVGSGSRDVWLAEPGEDGEFGEPYSIATSSQTATVLSGDFDGDGDSDIAFFGDIAEGARAFGLIFNDSGPTNVDLDGDGRPDECVPGLEFARGDTDVDGRRNITDAIVILLRLFDGGAASACADAADANDDGRIDIADPVMLLNYLFARGRTLPEPLECGLDLTADQLGCEVFPACGP